MEPAWYFAWAYSVATAMPSVTVDEVIWNWGLARVLGFKHCELRAAGEWTVPPTVVLRVEEVEQLLTEGKSGGDVFY